MVTRSRMTHRANTERDESTGQRNPFNQVVTSVEPVLTKQPCYWQSSRAEFRADGDRLLAITRHIILFPLAADVRELDRITSVTDRRGRVLQSNKLSVMAVVPREDHQEIGVEEYS